MRAGIKDLGYAHTQSSAVDHIVRDVAFGGNVTLWCEWVGPMTKFTPEPRVKGRVCLDCVDKKKSASVAYMRDFHDRPRKHSTCGLEHRPSEICPVSY